MVPKYWTIIPAAGIGVRMQADRPKQYLLYQGEPLLQRVVNCFASLPEIEKVVVVLHAKDHWWTTLNVTHPEKVLTVMGGKNRVDSVLLGLDFLKDFAKSDDWVIVHDSVRPCIQASDITRLMTELNDHEVGGLLALPVVDTLKQVDQNDLVQKTVSREHLWQAQTPQCFRYQLLRDAIEKALSDKQEITDESSAIEYVGLKPKIVLGNTRNIKITFPEDLELAASYPESL